MRIGFSKIEISPPIGMELGGYVDYRPNEGVHDPLYCKCIVLEQDHKLYAMVALDLLCADESLCESICNGVAHLGISRDRLIVYAIHTHAAPVGVIPGEGPLERINKAIIPQNPDYVAYMWHVTQAVISAFHEAVSGLESFQVRTAVGNMPHVGSDRHTGEVPRGELTVVDFLTESGKHLIFYSFPCHPTVLSASNLLISADFVAKIEELLHVDMAVFANGAAGDISTRFTRRESTFEECGRMAAIAAECIVDLIRDMHYASPSPLHGFHDECYLLAREVESVETAQEKLEETTKRWKQAVADGNDAGTIRILKSYVEGAGVNLEFSQLMGNIQSFTLPIKVFSFDNIRFVTVPGELYSTLLPDGVAAICYANGYYRYIADTNAYDNGHYEAMAAILRRGSGELLSKKIHQMLNKL